MVKFTSNEEMSNDAPYNYVSVTTSPILCMNNVLVLLHPATVGSALSSVMRPF